MPSEVYSTNGGRILEGPAPIADWAFTGSIPYTSVPDSAPVFERLDGFTNVPSSIVPFQKADMPANAVEDGDGSTPVEEGVDYVQVLLYNDNPVTEAFIVKADFMRSFSASP